MIVIAGWIQVDPARHAEAVTAAQAMMESSRHEAGCHAYHITQELGRPGSFRIFEAWRSQPALDAHFTAQHLKDFEQRITKLGVRSLGADLIEVASWKPFELPPHLQGAVGGP